MNIKDVEHYNNKTKSLTLVTGIKDMEDQTVEVKTYQYPFFVKGIYTKKAIELGVELEENKGVVTADLFDRFVNFYVELYGNQFTEVEFTQGIHQNDIIDLFVEMMFGVLQGDQKN